MQTTEGLHYFENPCVQPEEIRKEETTLKALIYKNFMTQIKAQPDVSTIFNHAQKSDPKSPDSTETVKKIIAASHWKYNKSEITFFPIHYYALMGIIVVVLVKRNQRAIRFLYYPGFSNYL